VQWEAPQSLSGPALSAKEKPQGRDFDFGAHLIVSGLGSRLREPKFVGAQLRGGLQPSLAQIENELAVRGRQFMGELQALLSVLSAVRAVHRHPRLNEHGPARRYQNTFCA
jgi:hypothetical protein